MVIQLSIEERCESVYTVRLGLLDILHAAKHVFSGVIKLFLVDAQLFFQANVVPLGFLDLAHGGIVGKTAVLKLLARALFTQIKVR